MQRTTPAPSIDATQVAFLVARYDFVHGTAHLFVNPQLDAEPAVSFSTFSTSSVFQRFRVSSDSGNTFVVDELRFGMTYADVTPHTVIPKPASLALLGLAGVLGLNRSRRS